MTIRFDDRVAIVTGAGNGLGREHALALAARGAKVLVNDFGGGRDGSGGSPESALRVADDIRAAGGEAIANGADVSQPDQVTSMVAEVLDTWGRIDVLINNAGVLRDRTFARDTFEDFRFVLAVHLMGSVHCTKAVWEAMCRQNYGRIVMTTSASGMYGNFGQSNYAAAKMGVIGLMNVLRLEGERHGIRVNAIAPAAATRMTEDLLPAGAHELMHPRLVSPGVLFLASEGAPNGAILSACAGAFTRVYINETRGAHLGADVTPELVAAHWEGAISDTSGQMTHRTATDSTMNFARLLGQA